MAAVIIFDADNTVWDTDTVFRAAQLAMLTTLGEAGYVPDPESQVEMLRVLDRELVEQLGVAEYDFRLLAGAIARFYALQLSATEAVGLSLTDEADSDPTLANLIGSAHSAFEVELTQIPPLYPHTELLLAEIQKAIDTGLQMATVLYSEGNETRLERILSAHKFRERAFFTEIILEPKSTEGFLRAQALGRARLGQGIDHVDTLVIGDSLRRDIAPANRIGCITVYKPSKFKGVEIPRIPEEQPMFTISDLGEFPSVLAQLGYDLRALA
jgi:putative hydrolase of the HAD superfamily